MIQLHTINLGMVNCYLLKSTTGTVLVDTGYQGQFKRIVKELKKISITPKDIDLIVLTHSHEDHTGSLSELLDASHAKLIMTQIEYDTWIGTLDDGIKPTTKASKFIQYVFAHLRISPLPKPIKPDIVFDSNFNLSQFGIAGELLLTPGHTKGSLSLLLDDKRVIIGDQLMAMMPWSKPGKPVIAYDMEEIKTSILGLIEKGATDFYLSHGKHYSATEIQSALLKLN